MTVSPVAFVREARSELSKVVWPTREETIRLTAVVILISVGIGFFIGGLDYVLTNIVTIIIRK